VQAVLQDSKTFSKAGRYTKFLARLSPAQREQFQYLQHHYEHGGLVQLDPPAHTRLRKLVNSAFTTRIVNQIDGLAADVIDELIATFAGEGEGELIYRFAFPLPAIVIAGMLGVPRDERDQFKDWSSTIQRFLGSGTVSFQYALAAQHAWQNMNGYFANLFAKRAARPRDSLVSGLAHAEVDGEM
jgi:cytochrome P450